MYELSKIEKETFFDNEERVKLMINDLEQQKEMRTLIRRRRNADPDQPVNYAGEKNRQYNERLAKFYGSYAGDMVDKDSKPVG